MIFCIFYPNFPIFLHRYICHICDISQLWYGMVTIKAVTYHYWWLLVTMVWYGNYCLLSHIAAPASNEILRSQVAGLQFYLHRPHLDLVSRRDDSSSGGRDECQSQILIFPGERMCFNPEVLAQANKSNAAQWSRRSFALEQFLTYVSGHSLRPSLVWGINCGDI